MMGFGRQPAWTALAFLMALCAAACDLSPSSPGDSEDSYSFITTVVGTGQAGLGGEGVPPLDSELYLPMDMTIGPDDRLYLLDWNNHRVRVVDGGLIWTFIGTGELGSAPPGPALQIGLNHPTHISFDPQGRLVMSAWHNSKILRYDPGTGYIQPICGTGAREYGGDGGQAVSASVNLPSSTAFDPAGRMYISDQASQRIRMVDLNGIITTIAGNGDPGFGGDGGPASNAQLYAPTGQSAQPTSRIATDWFGNIYVADTLNNRIRRIDAETGIITTIAGFKLFDEEIQTGDIEIESHQLSSLSEQVEYSGEGTLATEASLGWPCDVAVDLEGNVFIADTFNHCVRMVDTNNIITTVAGNCGEIGYGGDGGHPREAKLNRPYGVALDREGNLYIADTHNNRIRIVYK